MTMEQAKRRAVELGDYCKGFCFEGEYALGLFVRDTLYYGNETHSRGPQLITTATSGRTYETEPDPPWP